MKNTLLLPTLLVATLLTAIPHAHAANVPLPRSTPETQGLSPQAIREFVEALDKINTMHSFVVLRHGFVIAEGWWKPETADKVHVLNSVSKSFNSTAVGMAIADGKFNLDDLVLKFFPADAPTDLSDNLKAMTVRDLLTMSGKALPTDVAGQENMKEAIAKLEIRPAKKEK